MKRTTKYRYNDYFEFAMYILAFLCMIYFLIKGKPMKVIEPLLICAVLGAIRILVRYSKVEIFPALRFSVLLFIFIAMFLANVFNFYSVIPYLDKIEHLLSGVILFFAGLLLFRYLNRHLDNLQALFITSVYFSLFFSVALAAVWEIYEFSGDQLFGLRSQNGSLLDTMADIICGTIAAVLTSIFYYKRKKQDS
jgi:uncharacterized membrane protein YjdF